MKSINDDAIAYIKNLFEGNSGGHDAGHTLRVYKNAMEIAKHIQDDAADSREDDVPDCREDDVPDSREEVDLEAVTLAALLHDADDHKLFDTVDNQNARVFLQSRNIASDRIDWICEIINAVSFSQNKGKRPFCKEAEIVQDADRLDAIGAIGIARTFAYGGEHGRTIEDTVQHFYDKLLKLKDLMNTDAAIRIAEDRNASMIRFLKELESQIYQDATSGQESQIYQDATSGQESQIYQDATSKLEK